MPEKDYLGKDQRRTRDDGTKDDKPIKGTFQRQQEIFIKYLMINFVD